MKFLGIDLGWSSGASGVCALVEEAGGLRLIDCQVMGTAAQVLAWCDEYTNVDRLLTPTEPAIIAVDAPTIIANATGTRLSDRLTHRFFGRYHAGCYPANLGRPFAAHTVGFGASLTARGFSHAPDIEARSPGWFQIEVFPHPAMIHLFGLKRILKYKKGPLGDRAAGLAQLHHHITTTLPLLDPPLKLPLPFPSEFHNYRSKDLKAMEDQMDSLICAYIGAYWWHWGKARNWVLGNGETGYIVVPAPVADHAPCPDYADLKAIAQ